MESHPFHRLQVMKPQPISINIPQPCHENPASMQKNEQGKFCSACQKNVRDFSQMTDNEILEILGKEQGSGCGTFRAGQLNRLMVQTQLKGNNTRLNTIMAGLLLAAGAGAAHAQSSAHIPVPVPTVDTTGAMHHSVEPVTKDSVIPVFKGQVVDAEVGNPMIGVFVTLKGTSCRTNTDVNGNFSLTIPDSLMQDTLTFIVAYVAHEEQQLVIPQNHVGTAVTVRLYQSEMLIDGLYIAEPRVIEPEKKRKQK